MYQVEFKTDDGCEHTYFYDSWYDVLLEGVVGGFWLMVAGLLALVVTPWMAVGAARQQRRMNGITCSKDAEREYHKSRHAVGKATAGMVGTYWNCPLPQDQSGTRGDQCCVDGGRNPALGTLPGGDASPQQTPGVDQ